MFLIFISELKFSGPNNVVLSLISGLKKMDLDVTVSALRKRQDDDYVARVEALGGKVEKIGRLEPVTFFVTRMANKYKPMIINSHGIRADLAILITKSFYNCNLLSTIHNVPYEDYLSRYGALKSKVMLFAHSKVFKCQRIKKVAVSNNVRNKLLSRGAKNIHTVYNGVIFDNNENKLRRENLLAKLGLEKDRIKFVFCGHLDEIKQPLIVKEVAFHFSEYDFIILGDGPQREEMESGPSNLLVKGRVNNVLDYMYVSDFFIMPSLTEGMPMAFIEALYSNLYPICSDIDIFKELSSLPGISMRLFETGCSQSLKDVISSLNLDDNITNYLIAQQCFSDICMSQNYVALCDV
ncbi:glycosyltransferase family 4 protein [Pseudoalteromonas sp. S4389]|uniref:glycosyltransferase family 4 protein n=1 Tax=Pseudoalteromonas sp. S4389 TaxID=579556 RepID=UPI00148610F8|nr:glycosyltransferase family 4 protein [Pseudoalteromonas sp. S4389]